MPFTIQAKYVVKVLHQKNDTLLAVF